MNIKVQESGDFKFAITGGPDADRFVINEIGSISFKDSAPASKSGGSGNPSTPPLQERMPMNLIILIILTLMTQIKMELTSLQYLLLKETLPKNTISSLNSQSGMKHPEL